MSEISTKKRMKVFVSGPYKMENMDELELNLESALKAGAELLSKGHFPFISHLYYFLAKKAIDSKLELTWHHEAEYNLAILNTCDAILCLDNDKQGDLLLMTARSLGLKLYTVIDQIPGWEHKI